CSSKSFKLYSPKEPPNGNAFPPFHPGSMLDRDLGPTPMYPPTYLEPGIGRHTPYGNQTDYRIFELNKRLQNWTEKSMTYYSDAFVAKFFDQKEDGPILLCAWASDSPWNAFLNSEEKYLFLKSRLGVGSAPCDLSLKKPTKQTKLSVVGFNKNCTLYCHLVEQKCLTTNLMQACPFDTLVHQMVLSRASVYLHKSQDPPMLEQLSKNITRCGLSNSTLNYLRLCVILEPMQELMSRHKTYSLSPRDCLKTCLFQKWQRMVAPPAEPARQQPSKRRKRKMSGGSTMSSGGGSANSNSKKKSPAGSFALSSQVPDVMVVGEPTLMGGEFGDEDERLITRLENTQFDAANGIDDEDSFNNSPALGANSPWNSKPPSSQESKTDNPTSQASQ
uniref:LIM domain binding 1 n=1 Tax=Latimeria chalumnae TaxID=7897 RepID=H3AC57_LATCH